MASLPSATNSPALLPETEAGLRDIVGPLRILSWSEILVVVALTVLALVAAYFLWKAWRDRQARRLLPPPPPPPLPPDVRALRDLDLALRLLSDPDAFCTEVSRILRLYLEERFGWNAPDRTTEEFLAEIQPRPDLHPDLKTSLPPFLDACDQVKFARHIPTETDLRHLHRTAIQIIHTTTPVPGVSPLPTLPPSPPSHPRTVPSPS